MIFFIHIYVCNYIQMNVMKRKRNNRDDDIIIKKYTHIII